VNVIILSAEAREWLVDQDHRKGSNVSSGPGQQWNDKASR
jgi:hypothetical protein